MPHDAEPRTEGSYENAVGDVTDKTGAPKVERDVVESNSSNYGGSAVADKPIEERVLDDK